MIERMCQHCEKLMNEVDRSVTVKRENIRIFRAAYPNIENGFLCLPCYDKWRRKIKDPRMCLKKLYCGICLREEPTATFNKNFKRIDGRLIPSYRKITRRENIIIGPICTICESLIDFENQNQVSKFSPISLYGKNSEETSDDQMEFEESNVDLSINFPEDEFFKMPHISKISK
jgi:hypothetical protein